jgi:hypothetical protein
MAFVFIFNNVATRLFVSYKNYLEIFSYVLMASAFVQSLRLYLFYDRHDAISVSIAFVASLHLGFLILSIAEALGVRLHGTIRSDL